MRKVFLENLKLKKYKGRECIDWKLNVKNKEKVYFEYDNIKGYFKLIGYNANTEKLIIKCSIYNITHEIKPDDLKKCKIKTIIQTIYNISKVIKYFNIAKKLHRALTKKEYLYFNVYGKGFNSGLEYLGYIDIKDFQKKNNFLRIIKPKYTYCELYINYKEFFDKYDRFPVNSDYKNDKNLITKYQMFETLKYENITIDEFFKKISGTSFNQEEYEYNKTINKFKSICEKYNKIIPYRKLQEKIGHDIRWIMNRNSDIKSYKDFYLSFGFKQESDLTKDEVKQRILKMKSKLNRPLMYDDFRENDNFDSVGILTVKKFWGTMNKMKEDLGLEIIQEDMISKQRSKEDMLNDLQKLINELGRLPLSKEIDSCSYTLSVCSYNKFFGGINNAFIQLGYIPNKKSISLHLSDEDVIKIYKEFIEDNGFPPSYEYAKTIYELPAPITAIRRFNCTWNEFIKMLGYEPNDCRYNKTIASDGTVCSSTGEAVVHNYLLKLPIKNLQKETLYKDILDNEELQEKAGFKRLDWTFDYNGQTYYVELFGMMGIYNYNKRHDFKINLIKRDGKMDNFIAIYPKDLNKLNKIFEFVK